MSEPNSMSFEEVKERILNMKAQKPLVWDPVNRKFTFRRNVIIDLEDIDTIFKSPRPRSCRHPPRMSCVPPRTRSG